MLLGFHFKYYYRRKLYILANIKIARSYLKRDKEKMYLCAKQTELVNNLAVSRAHFEHVLYFQWKLGRDLNAVIHLSFPDALSHDEH